MSVSSIIIIVILVVTMVYNIEMVNRLSQDIKVIKNTLQKNNTS